MPVCRFFLRPPHSTKVLVVHTLKKLTHSPRPVKEKTVEKGGPGRGNLDDVVSSMRCLGSGDFPPGHLPSWVLVGACVLPHSNVQFL